MGYPKKVYKSLKDYKRCLNIFDEEQAIKEGYKDVSEILSASRPPRFTDTTSVWQDKELTYKIGAEVPELPEEKDVDEVSEDEVINKLQAKQEKNQKILDKGLAEKFCDMYKGRRPYRDGKPTKLFREFKAKHKE